MIAGIVATVIAFIGGAWAYISRINKQNDKMMAEKSVLVVEKQEAEVKLEASKKTDDDLARDIDNLLHPAKSNSRIQDDR